MKLRRSMVITGAAGLLFVIAPLASPAAAANTNTSCPTAYDLYTKAQTWPLYQADYPGNSYTDFLAAYATVDKNGDGLICLKFTSQSAGGQRFAIPFDSRDNGSNAGAE